MNRHDRVLSIVLAAEHLLDLARVDFLREILEPARHVVADGLPLLRPFEEDAEVVGAPFQRIAELTILFETAAALQQLLGGRLVLPEVRVRNALFDSGEFVRGTGGVKDSSADRTRVWRGPDTGGAGRRVDR